MEPQPECPSEFGKFVEPPTLIDNFFVFDVKADKEQFVRICESQSCSSKQGNFFEILLGFGSGFAEYSLQEYVNGNKVGSPSKTTRSPLSVNQYTRFNVLYNKGPYSVNEISLFDGQDINNIDLSNKYVSLPFSSSYQVNYIYAGSQSLESDADLYDCFILCNDCVQTPAPTPTPLDECPTDCDKTFCLECINNEIVVTKQNGVNTRRRLPIQIGEDTELVEANPQNRFTNLQDWQNDVMYCKGTCPSNPNEYPNENDNNTCDQDMKREYPPNDVAKMTGFYSNTNWDNGWRLRTNLGSPCPNSQNRWFASVEIKGVFESLDNFWTKKPSIERIKEGDMFFGFTNTKQSFLMGVAQDGSQSILGQGQAPCQLTYPPNGESFANGNLYDISIDQFSVRNENSAKQIKGCRSFDNTKPHINYASFPNANDINKCDFTTDNSKGCPGKCNDFRHRLLTPYNPDIDPTALDFSCMKCLGFDSDSSLQCDASITIEEWPLTFEITVDFFSDTTQIEFFKGENKRKQGVVKYNGTFNLNEELHMFISPDYLNSYFCMKSYINDFVEGFWITEINVQNTNIECAQEPVCPPELGQFVEPPTLKDNHFVFDVKADSNQFVRVCETQGCESRQGNYYEIILGVGNANNEYSITRYMNGQPQIPTVVATNVALDPNQYLRFYVFFNKGPFSNNFITLFKEDDINNIDATDIVVQSFFDSTMSINYVYAGSRSLLTKDCFTFCAPCSEAPTKTPTTSPLELTPSPTVGEPVTTPDTPSPTPRDTGINPNPCPAFCCCFRDRKMPAGPNDYVILDNVATIKNGLAWTRFSTDNIPAGRVYDIRLCTSSSCITDSDTSNQIILQISNSNEFVLSAFSSGVQVFNLTQRVSLGVPPYDGEIDILFQWNDPRSNQLFSTNTGFFVSIVTNVTTIPDDGEITDGSSVDTIFTIDFSQYFALNTLQYLAMIGDSSKPELYDGLTFTNCANGDDNSFSQTCNATCKNVDPLSCQDFTPPGVCPDIPTDNLFAQYEGQQFLINTTTNTYTWKDSTSNARDLKGTIPLGCDLNITKYNTKCNFYGDEQSTCNGQNDKSVSGGSTCSIPFADDTLPVTYTIQLFGRRRPDFDNTNNGIIIGTPDELYYTGWGPFGEIGVARHDNVLYTSGNTSESIDSTLYNLVLGENWLLITDKRSLFRVNGDIFTDINTPTQLINYQPLYINPSSNAVWEILEILIWKTELTIEQIKCLENFYWKPRYDISISPQCPDNNLDYPFTLNGYVRLGMGPILNEPYTRPSCSNENSQTTLTTFSIQGNVNSNDGGLYVWVITKYILHFYVGKNEAFISATSFSGTTPPSGTQILTSVPGSRYGTEPNFGNNSPYPYTPIPIRINSDGSFVISFDVHDFLTNSASTIAFLRGTSQYRPFADIAESLLPSEAAFSIISIRDNTPNSNIYEILLSNGNLAPTPGSESKLYTSSTAGSSTTIMGITSLTQCLDVSNSQSIITSAISSNKHRQYYQEKGLLNTKPKLYWTFLLSFSTILNFILIVLLVILIIIKRNCIVSYNKIYNMTTTDTEKIHKTDNDNEISVSNNDNQSFKKNGNIYKPIDVDPIINDDFDDDIIKNDDDGNQDALNI